MNPWKIILVLVGIFAAGGVTGGFVTLKACKDKMMNRPVPEEWEPKHLKKLSDRLDLTPEQREQVRPIIRRKIEHLHRLRNHSMEETRVVVEAMQREISEMLTPEQRVKFEQMNRELREAREARERQERERHEREKKEKAKAQQDAVTPVQEKALAPAEKASTP
jgi:Spy/CpxP family protein refolding chaperone